MCGRYQFTGGSGDEKMDALLRLMEKNYPGQYKTGEIFPGDTAPGMIAREAKIVPVPAVFGFPGFQAGRLLINARAETVFQKRTFAESMRTRRILLPATGFFEWGRDPEKTRYLFTSGRPVFYLCGLYQLIEGVFRFVILTRAADDTMAEIHDRMPVIAEEDQVRPWLTDLAAARCILSGAAPRLTRQKA